MSSAQMTANACRTGVCGVRGIAFCPQNVVEKYPQFNIFNRKK